jgi:hypothetical protein
LGAAAAAALGAAAAAAAAAALEGAEVDSAAKRPLGVAAGGAGAGARSASAAPARLLLRSSPPLFQATVNSCARPAGSTDARASDRRAAAPARRNMAARSAE